MEEVAAELVVVAVAVAAVVTKIWDDLVEVRAMKRAARYQPRLH